MDSKKALETLVEGNKRFVNNRMMHPNQDINRRKELFEGQKPYAVIVACSDSRVAPEIIFDVGLGDVFIIRTAGNVVDDVALGSIEYAVEHLGTTLLMVLGHEGCGAVSATVKGGAIHNHISSIVEKIVPAVEKARCESGDLLKNSIRNNVMNFVNELSNSTPVLANFVKENKLDVIGAVYDWTTGKVIIID